MYYIYIYMCICTYVLLKLTAPVFRSSQGITGPQKGLRKRGISV